MAFPSCSSASTGILNTLTKKPKLEPQQSQDYTEPTLPEGSINTTDVNVISGNILESKCEVLVNTTGSDFNLKGIKSYKLLELC